MIYEEESDEEEEEIHIEDLEQSPPKMEDNKPQVHDPKEEVNLGTMEEPRITYIVMPQNLGIPLTNCQPMEFLWISGNPTPHCCVPFIEIHIFTKIR